ncbi:protein MAIN-LIKE 2-like [Euphorbia lathyris]|uniref:protein MAIN-LIKE 2-like n=1 Tax=Euphorbia lathyris TaxID=212925 RepID=UPI003313927B
MADAQRAHETVHQPMDEDYVAVDVDNESFEDESSDDDNVLVLRLSKARGDRSVSSESSGSSTKRPRDAEEDWIVTDPVPGGPVDGSVIPSFLGHVASRMWSGHLRSQLKGHTRGHFCKKLMTWYTTASPRVKKLIRDSRLSHLPSIMYPHIDMPLICVFIERWHPDTSSFHMPFGEMTILLHDVWEILCILVDGRLVSAESGIEQSKSAVMELFGVTKKVLESVHWKGGGVVCNSIVSMCSVGQMSNFEAIGWMFLLLGSTLFIDKSGDRIRPICLLEVQDGVEGVGGYSWGSAILAYLYRQLGIASRGDCS